MKMSLQPWETSIEDGLQAAVLSGTLTIQGYLALTAADKDVNNGVCSLNGLGLPQDKSGNDVSMAADLTSHAADTTAIHGIPDTSKLAVIASGNYTGNDSTNRAIVHGLGITPEFVRINMLGAGNANWDIMGNIGRVKGNDAASNFNYVVTQMNSTNFYVGNATSYAGSANGTGNTYYWVAMG